MHLYGYYCQDIANNCRYPGNGWHWLEQPSEIFTTHAKVFRQFRSADEVAEDALENYYEYFQVKGPVRYQRQMVWLRNLVYVNMQNGKLCLRLSDERVLETNATYKMVKELLPSKCFF